MVLKEYLKRCAEFKAFPWAVVEFVHDTQQFFVRDPREIAILRHVLSDKPVHVFVSTSFPSGIRVSEEEIDFQLLSNPFVLSKLFAIIPGDRMHAFGLLKSWKDRKSTR